MGLTSSSPPFYAGEQEIRVKKVRPPSKTWMPPANPEPKQEEKKEEEQKKKEEEQEKREEEKHSPKAEAGKMLCSGAPSRLTNRSFPGASGQAIPREGKGLALMGICILTGEEKREKGLSFEKWDPKATLGKAMASQRRHERDGASN